MVDSIVTGAAGFVGANLVRRLLNDGREVVAVVRPTSDLWRLPADHRRLRLVEADLRSPELHRAIPDLSAATVFHLAARGGHGDSVDSRRQGIDDTVVATWNLFEQLRVAQPKKVIHAGSGLEHGWTGRAPHREDDHLMPQGFRGAVKACASLLAHEFAQSTGIRVSCLRIYTVYGPFEQPGRLVPNAICASLDGQTLQRVTGNFRRDYLHVDDVVGAMLAVENADESGTGDPWQIINVASGIDHSTDEVVNEIERATGASLLVSDDPFPLRGIESAHCLVDTTRIREQFSWSPRSLETGLAQTVDWYRRIDRGRYRA